MYILVINAGSSSLKYQLFDLQDDATRVLAAGMAERIGEAGGGFKHKAHPDSGDERTVTAEAPIADHAAAMRLVIDALCGGEAPAIDGPEAIGAVGHRVVHGGEAFYSATVVDGPNGAVLEAIRANIPLAPLHNPANLTGIEVAMDLMPAARQVAVFDTAFHQTMPDQAYMYALPYEIYENYGVRKYGFHGASHAYVARETARLIGKAPEEANLITAHLGNGASMAAVRAGKCVDTSLGMTPLAGLIMGTRTGDFDPAILFYLARNADMDLDRLDAMVNKQSGLKGVCGHNDLRDVHKAADAGDERARLALRMLAYRNKHYIGAYMATLGRVDAIAFTAGVGENDPRVRAASLEGLENLGVVLDTGLNEAGGGRFATPTRISAEGSAVQVWVTPTNEELEIARQTKEALA